MSRIAKKFTALKKDKKKALILFITAGDPNLRKTEELIYAFEKEGVDMIELGVPFSDPLADGPVIQAASQRALEKGTTLAKILALVQKVRKRSQIPLLLMTYLNPILQYGTKAFSEKAKKVGVDGIIVPDLPPEEGKELSSFLKKNGVDLVYLLAPTSTDKRRRFVVRASRGFVYYVSLTGVTGVNSLLPQDFRKNILAAKKETKLPVCVGFGVSTPEQAKNLSAIADGVIVGSAIVKQIATAPGMPAQAFSKKFVRPFAQALKKRKS